MTEAVPRQDMGAKRQRAHSVLLLGCGFFLFAGSCFAQLTPEQKEADFRYLAGLYAKQYAPYEWKRTAFGFDLLHIGAWLERVRQTRDDLDFYEVCVEYVAALNDTHDSYVLPSDFFATLNFTVDIYDGKVLIDSINRTRLPQRDFPFVVGDELLSVDGKDAEQLVRDFSKYAIQSNPLSTRRQAAARLVARPQSRMPRAHELGESAVITVRLQIGEIATYTVPWIKTGTPVHVGPVPTPKASVAAKSAVTETNAQADDESAPEYMKALEEIQYSGVSEPYGVLGYGGRTPLFALPDNFTQRLGRLASDFFYSGVYEAGGFRIGYIRIPNYGSLAASVLQQFESEIAYFQANTDGLVVDEMRNTGGFLCFGENIAARLTPYRFRATGFYLRATRSRLNSFFNSLNAARAQGAEQWVIDLYEALFRDMATAYSENRGLTGSLPLCTPSLDREPARDRNDNMIAYTKPVILLVDEFSTSTADSVAAMFQDARRGLVVGMRTNGAGGTNTRFAAGAYAEGSAGMTLGLMTRKDPVATPDYPTAAFIESIGVRPDVELDFMTRDNLLQRGRPFVNAFTAVIVDQIKAGR